MIKIHSSDKPFDVNAARSCLIMNQLATPGLGSLAGKRFVAGTGQLALAIAGFLLVLAWFLLTMKEAYGLAYNEGPVKSYGLLGIVGGVLFIISWCWALTTSLSLMREAKNAARKTPPPITPPPITKPPTEI